LIKFKQYIYIEWLKIANRIEKWPRKYDLLILIKIETNYTK
jgi:hypothetical protein